MAAISPIIVSDGHAFLFERNFSTCILIKFYIEIFQEGRIYNKLASGRITVIAWCQICDKPLPEPVARPQYINSLIPEKNDSWKRY